MIARVCRNLLRRRPASLRLVRASLSSLCLLLAAFVLPRVALAHAVLVSSTPAADGTVSGPATVITLRFNSRVNARLSSLKLTYPGGNEQPLAIDSPADRSTLQAHADHLSKGSYTLHWQILASDGHLTRGIVVFAVR